jgi:hypothetical protein
MVSAAAADADADLLRKKNTAEWLVDKLKRTRAIYNHRVNSY